MSTNLLTLGEDCLWQLLQMIVENSIVSLRCPSSLSAWAHHLASVHGATALAALCGCCRELHVRISPLLRALEKRIIASSRVVKHAGSLSDGSVLMWQHLLLSEEKREACSNAHSLTFEESPEHRIDPLARRRARGV